MDSDKMIKKLNSMIKDCDKIKSMYYDRTLEEVLKDTPEHDKQLCEDANEASRIKSILDSAILMIQRPDGYTLQFHNWRD